MGLFDFFLNRKEYSNDKINLSNTKKGMEIQKEGYLELSEICRYKNGKIDFSAFVQNLKDYSNDEDYMSTLNYVIDCLYQKGNSFIINLDWKEEISSLFHGVNQILTGNFNSEIELPQPENYGERASVSSDNVFKDFDKAINEKGYQLSFIDTNSDEYVIVVHKIEDLEAAKNAIRKIGYDCLNANSRKISG